MTLTTEDLASLLARVSRYWPAAPAFSDAEKADWCRTLSRFDAETVTEAIDFWASEKPRFRPDLPELLATTRQKSRQSSDGLARIPSAKRDEPADISTETARKHLASLREIVGSSRPRRVFSSEFVNAELARDDDRPTPLAPGSLDFAPSVRSRINAHNAGADRLARPLSYAEAYGDGGVLSERQEAAG